MHTLHVSEHGTTLRKKSRRIVVEKAGVTIAQVRMMQLKRVFLYGHVQISTQAMHLLLQEGIDLVFFNAQGRFIGRVTGKTPKNIPLRIKQFDNWKDEVYRLKTCRNLVAGKIHNMASVLKRYQYRYPDLDVGEVIAKLQAREEQVIEAKDSASLLGIEGSATGQYFSAYRLLFRHDLRFTKRLKRPSPDPVNALLSLGYVMITNEISSILEGVALDPHLGYYHEPKYGRKSLALDLVEQFRQPLIDVLTVKLANLSVFKECDFETRDDDQGVFLKPEAFKRYLCHYEDTLGKNGLGDRGHYPVDTRDETISPPFSHRHVGWRRIIHHQITRFEKDLLEGTVYVPYRMQVKSKTNPAGKVATHDDSD